MGPALHERTALTATHNFKGIIVPVLTLEKNACMHACMHACMTRCASLVDRDWPHMHRCTQPNASFCCGRHRLVIIDVCMHALRRGDFDCAHPICCGLTLVLQRPHPHCLFCLFQHEHRTAPHRCAARCFRSLGLVAMRDCARGRDQRHDGA